MDRSLRQSSSTWAQPEILSRIALTTAALTRLKPVWIDKGISLCSKIRLMHSLVTSIFLYACQSWTLTAVLQRRIQAMEMRCYHKILHTSYKDHVTNEEVRSKIQQAIGPHEDLTIVKRFKLQWYGHVSRSSGLAKTILQGTVKEGRRQGGQRKRWEDNIRECTGLELSLIHISEPTRLHRISYAVFFNGSTGTTVGVRQGCLLSPTLFNIFLERIMTDALDHEGTVSI